MVVPLGYVRATAGVVPTTTPSRDRVTWMLAVTVDPIELKIDMLARVLVRCQSAGNGEVLPKPTAARPIPKPPAPCACACGAAKKTVVAIRARAHHPARATGNIRLPPFLLGAR